MPKTRQEKEDIVGVVAEKFRNMKAAAFTSVSGLTMPQSDELRQKASEQNVEVFVTKKTLLGLAAKEAGLEGIDPAGFDGSILTAVSYGDEVSAAKLLKEFDKAHKDILTFVAGVLEGKGLTAEEVTALAALPSKQQLLGMLVGTLNAPVSGFVNVLAGNLRGLVTVLDAIKEQKTA
ncbi:MAG: 50S ribosomal protein L10 [Candidatus Uhrbacteria bacterium]|nr:50S ribosomal protein L10 [Candidatus Uhrbacteria bacterium]